MKLTQTQIKKLITYAQSYKGIPYERGASAQTKALFDCSSFIQHIFKHVGTTLPRSSILQAAEPQGVLLLPKKHKKIVYKKGDVIFMASDRGYYFDEVFAERHLCIGHVGLYIGNGKIINARKSAGGVVIESLSELQKDIAYKTVAVRRYTEERPVYAVPPRSQYIAIHHHAWKDKSCGIVSVGMILSFYKKRVDLNVLLAQGLKLNAFKEPVGWIHQGLVRLAQLHKFQAKAYDWSKDSIEEAFLKLVSFLEEGPIIASIHKDFDPQNGGHLIVVTGYRDGLVYYNEPASRKGEPLKRKIIKEKFITGWKRRMVALYIHPYYTKK